ncbi:MAG: 6-bladed beta-propeller [Tannerella sp.]|nr:6-bladed beta-propeller [Tannerella sp.]
MEEVKNVNLKTQLKEPFTINLSKSREYLHVFKLTDIASEVKYIPLETNDLSLIGNRYSYPKFTKDYLYIDNGGIIMQFDMTGKFVRSINRKGQGPGECSARDFDIDEKNQLIHIFDNWNLGIYSFDFEGKHVKTLRNPFSDMSKADNSPVHMGCDKNGNFVFTFGNNSGKMEYKYIVTNREGETLYKCPNYIKYSINEPKGRTRQFSMPFFDFYTFNDCYYYDYAYNDTVFRINDDFSCTPYYIRNLPNKKTLEDILKRDAGIIQNSELAGKNGYDFCREDNKYIYIYHYQYPVDNNYKSFLSRFDKDSGELLENINVNVANNWDGGMDIELSPAFQQENTLCMMFQPFEMQEKLTEEHFRNAEIAFSEESEALRTMVNGLKEDDNPVLMVIKLK